MVGQRVGNRLQREVPAELVAPAAHHYRPGPGRLLRPVVDEGRLPDAGFAGHDDERRPAGRRLRQRGVEAGELGSAPGEGQAPGRAGGDGRRAVTIGGGQSGAVQGLGLRRRRDTEVLRQPLANPGVGGERRRRPPGGQMGPHEGAQGGLVVRIVRQRRLGEGRSTTVVAGGHGGVDGDGPGPGDVRLGGGPLGEHPLAVLLRQQRATRQFEGGGSGSTGGADPPVAQGVGGSGGQGRHLVDVQPLGDQRVPARRPQQAVGADHAAQP
ncbi:MAG TPA: hypothetical protein VG455_10340 [Acidimicrobiales bacterium]|nr:hypothetical protein [Acidimicrobiales bacterium]